MFETYSPAQGGEDLMKANTTFRKILRDLIPKTLSLEDRILAKVKIAQMDCNELRSAVLPLFPKKPKRKANES